MATSSKACHEQRVCGCRSPRELTLRQSESIHVQPAGSEPRAPPLAAAPSAAQQGMLLMLMAGTHVGHACCMHKAQGRSLRGLAGHLIEPIMPKAGMLNLMPCNLLLIKPGTCLLATAGNCAARLTLESPNQSMRAMKQEPALLKRHAYAHPGVCLLAIVLSMPEVCNQAAQCNGGTHAHDNACAATNDQILISIGMSRGHYHCNAQMSATAEFTVDTVGTAG